MLWGRDWRNGLVARPLDSQIDQSRLRLTEIRWMWINLIGHTEPSQSQAEFTVKYKFQTYKAQKACRQRCTERVWNVVDLVLILETTVGQRNHVREPSSKFQEQRKGHGRKFVDRAVGKTFIYLGVVSEEFTSVGKIRAHSSIELSSLNC